MTFLQNSFKMSRTQLLVHLTLCLLRLSSAAHITKTSLSYCSEDRPLETKYFIPLYETHVPVRGCFSHQVSTNYPGYQVHYVRINTTSKEVMLHFNENSSKSKGLILVLDSETPIQWRLSFLGDSLANFSRILCVSKESTLLSTDGAIAEYKSMSEFDFAGKSSDEELINTAVTTWGGLTTFSRVTGANRISISMPKGESLPSVCSIIDDSSVSLSPVLAYLYSKQPMTGCFRSGVTNESGPDTFIVDMTSAEPEPDDSQLGLLPPVYFSISPELKVTDVISKNITLILRSKYRVRWFLESWGLAGSLTVISNNGPIENFSLSPFQSLSTTQAPLPAVFEKLWKWATIETESSPISYVKVDHANVISLIVPQIAESRSRWFQHDPAKLVPDAASYLGEETKQNRVGTGTQFSDDDEIFIPAKVVQDISIQERLQFLEKTLTTYMGKTCTESQVMIITLPLSISDVFNVTGIRFQEVGCNGTKNETHWILKAQSTSCGSISHLTEKNPVVRNHVHLKFAPGSEFFGAKFQIPVSCRFAAGLAGLGGEGPTGFESTSQDQLSDYDHDDDDDIASDNLKEDEMYVMKVLKISPGRVALLMENLEDSATVTVGDKLKIETDFDTRMFFNIALEECWITTDAMKDTQEPQVKDGPNRRLILRGCSSDSDVTLSSDSGFPSFTFNVTEDLQTEKHLYLTCIIGICSPSAEGSGNIPQCYDTSSCEENDALSNVRGPAAQQLIRRGPIFVLSEKDHIQISDEPADGLLLREVVDMRTVELDNLETVTETPSIHSAHVVLVGVSPEIAAIIAIASFSIGAALTGLLCWVHHKRLMPKETESMRTNVLVDSSELQAMITQPQTKPDQE